MAIPYTTTINPKGKTPQEKQDDLIRQLQLQNKELKVIIEDLYREIENGREQ